MGTSTSPVVGWPTDISISMVVSTSARGPFSGPSSTSISMASARCIGPPLWALMPPTEVGPSSIGISYSGSSSASARFIGDGTSAAGRVFEGPLGLTIGASRSIASLRLVKFETAGAETLREISISSPAAAATAATPDDTAPRLLAPLLRAPPDFCA